MKAGLPGTRQPSPLAYLLLASSCPQTAPAPREGLQVWEHKTESWIVVGGGVMVSEEDHGQLPGLPEKWGTHCYEDLEVTPIVYCSF